MGRFGVRRLAAVDCTARRVLIPLLDAIIAVGQLRRRRPLRKVTPGA